MELIPVTFINEFEAKNSSLRKGGANPLPAVTYKGEFDMQVRWKQGLVLVAAAFSGSVFAAQVINADIAVIGSGFAGMSAAADAAMNGKKVVVLEKQAFPGGASILCGGQYAIQGTKLQKSLGVPNDPPQSLVKDLILNGHNKNDLTTLILQAENSPRVTDWVIDTFKPVFIDNKLKYRAEFEFDRSLYLKGYCSGFYPKVQSVAEKAGVKLLLGTKAESLVVKGGRVTGIKAKKGNQAVTVNAKAVLLATGGYGANKAMLVEPLKSALYYGPASSTGDGHRMASAIGAKLENMEYGKRYPNGIESAPGVATSIIQGNYRAWLESGFLVNKDGKRVVNEKASNNNIMAVLEKQPGKLLYIVLDEPSFAKFVEGIKTQGVTDAQLKEWLANNGSKAPIFAHGDSLEAAAKAAGINPTNLRATLERYNGFVRAKKDEDFGRPVKFMVREAKTTGAYYIVEQKPRFATTMGSVVVDDHLRVLGASGKPIRGLYAAGEVINAMHGDDSSPGMNISWAFTSGKLSSEFMRGDMRK